MDNIQQWLTDTLATITTIAHGNPTDQDTKDKVDLLISQMTALTAQLSANDSTDANQTETEEALKAAITALVNQIAVLQPPAPPQP